MSTYRYHSRLIAVVHSWQSETPIDLSPDIIAVSTSKGIKSVGQFTIVVSPAKNWFNMIFQNDVVNIYYDPGDGVSGWTRVMMGYVDRVYRSESVVDENGRTATAFTIAGQDFMKAVDRTEIVFRPELAQRPDWKLEERFFFNNIGGMGMMFRGVIGEGPPDVIVNGIMAGMMGYGAQWQLPKSYASFIQTPIVAQGRRRRTQEARKRISSDLMTALQTLGFNDMVGDGPQKASDLSNRLMALFKQVFSNSKKSKANAKALATVRAESMALTSYVNAVLSETNNPSGGIFDLMDPSFVEGKCIDGYADAAAVWQAEGAVSNTVYKWSNPNVNEVIFDLRPAIDGDNSMMGDYYSSDIGTQSYSRAKDDIGINVSGFGLQGSTVSGVKYVPTMIMREYPYSTSPGLDMRAYKALGVSLGDYQAFGPIFSTPTNSSDSVQRVFYDYRDFGDGQYENGITSAPDIYDETAPPLKHMDVATVKLNEMTRMDVSRGDGDTFNLFVIYQTLYPTATQFNIPDYLPIFNLASIARDGVRMREITTNYAGWTSRSDGVTRNDGVPYLLLRWATLLDHWYQHNAEYLSGTITMRPRADIRVGYRLDIPERAESYYVTDVRHSWEKQGDGSVRGATTIQVNRGQRTDPFPIYIPPSFSAKNITGVNVTGAFEREDSVSERSGTGWFDATFSSETIPATQISGNRGMNGRLSRSFKVRPSTATARAGDQDSDSKNMTDLTPAPGTGVYVPGGPTASGKPTRSK